MKRTLELHDGAMETAKKTKTTENKYEQFVQNIKDLKQINVNEQLKPMLVSCSPMEIYEKCISMFQGYKGMDGKCFEETLSVPEHLRHELGLQGQIRIVNGMMDNSCNDGREDFAPYLLSEGPYKNGEKVPVIISHKISLRERWKEDIGIAAYSRVFLITLGGMKTNDLSVQKLKKAKRAGIDIVVPEMREFQTPHFMSTKRPLCLSEETMWNRIMQELGQSQNNIPYM
jgi:hypothetical protein